jgi:hypothetical protein
MASTDMSSADESALNRTLEDQLSFCSKLATPIIRERPERPHSARACGKFFYAALSVLARHSQVSNVSCVGVLCKSYNSNALGGCASGTTNDMGPTRSVSIRRQMILDTGFCLAGCRTNSTSGIHLVAIRRMIVWGSAIQAVSCVLFTQMELLLGVLCVLPGNASLAIYHLPKPS